MPPKSTSSRSSEPEPQDKSIPGTQVLDWRAQTTRPRLRRPVTACQACRSAKAKCSGQANCQRCKKRGLKCVSIRTPSDSDGSINGHLHARKHNSTTPLMLADDIPSGRIAENTIDHELAITDNEIPNFTSTINGGEDLNERALNDALEQFDWIFPDPQVNFDPYYSSVPNDANHSGPGSYDIVSWEIRPPMLSPSALSQQIQLPSISCECRVSMMIHVPKLECAIRAPPQPQLDTMFKLTGEIIQSCQKSADCSCFKGPVDLVCIMTAFEQTAVCFDYIAKSGVNGTVKVGIGNYCISRTDDASFKRMLVLDLVGRADKLLDSLTSLAQDMESQHQPSVKAMGRSPRCLNKLNLHYIQEVVASFKKLFGLIQHGLFETDT